MFHHGELVSVYDYSGRFELRGKIVGINRTNPVFYDVQPLQEFTMKNRINGICETRIRKHYIASHLIDIEPKHILDEV